MTLHGLTFLTAASTPPAGGGSTGQVIGGTIGATILTALMLYVAIGHRSGKLKFVQKLADRSGEILGLPGWSALPLLVLGDSLLIAVFGMYWDISIHLDNGRDPGPFANTAHYFILAGLFGIFFAGLLGVALPKRKEGPTFVRIADGWYAPLGGVLILACAAFALSGFPLDDIWHRIFGQDVTLWGPTHLLLFGGASLATLGGVILLAEGLRDRGDRTPAERPRVLRVFQATLVGSLLIGMSTFQGEFDYAVPQFRLVWHPILLMLAASVALVIARIYFGKGGALYAVGFFLLIRGTMTLIVSPLAGHTLLHFPLYIVEALTVEAVALRVPRDQPIKLGVIAGALIGTIGLAAEWGWSYVWWTVEWPSSMLLEGIVAGFVTAVAGGVVGAFVGRAITAGDVPPRPVPRLALPVALVALIAVFAYAAPVSSGDPIKAQVTLTDAKPAPKREVNARIKLTPANAADKDVRWFLETAWQGKEGRSVVAPLKKVGPGTWVSTKPIPAYGTWKSTIRLHKGTAFQGMAVFLPKDEAIPVKEIPAKASFTRTFVRDTKLLQREQKADVPGFLKVFAYITVLIIGLGLYGSMGWGLARLQKGLSRDRAAV
jgi:hypothetical protein